jgi:hypothetical protein
VHLGVEQQALDAVAFEQHPREVGFDARRETGEFYEAQAVPPTVSPSISRVG